MEATVELPPLATVADVEQYVDLTEAEVDVEQLLASASASVRDATGQILTRTTTTVPVTLTDSARVRLYQQPVMSVERVVLEGRELTGWSLDAGELYRPGGWAADRRTAYVTYTHGYEPIPTPIRDLVVQLVLAAIAKLAEDGMLGTMPGVRQESISDTAYAVTYGSDEPTPSTVFELPERTRAWLRQSWGAGGAGSVQVR